MRRRAPWPFLLLLSLGLLAATGPSFADEPPRVGLTVVAMQDALTPKIRAHVLKALAREGIETTDRVPAMEIVVFASQDTNDRKNTEGVSIAFAYTSNVNAQRLALDYVRRKDELPDTLIGLLRGHGELLHINVAHLDEASEEALDVLADAIVGNFKQRYLDGDGNGH